MCGRNENNAKYASTNQVECDIISTFLCRNLLQLLPLWPSVLETAALRDYEIDDDIDEDDNNSSSSSNNNDDDDDADDDDSNKDDDDNNNDDDNVDDDDDNNNNDKYQ